MHSAAFLQLPLATAYGTASASASATFHCQFPLSTSISAHGKTAYFAACVRLCCSALNALLHLHLH